MRAMQCPIQSGENAELLLTYCARNLDPETQRILERHITQCPQCRAFAEQQKAVWEALDAWEALPVSPDFDQRLYRRIEAAGQSARPAGWLAWVPRPLPLAAASVVLAAVLLLRAPERPAAPEADQVELLEVERAELALEDIEMLRTLNLLARVERPGPQPM